MLEIKVETNGPSSLDTVEVTERGQKLVLLMAILQILTTEKK